MQFLFLGSMGAACACVNREHLLVRLRRGGLKVCGLQHFPIVGIIKLLADSDRLFGHAASQFVSASPFQLAQFVALVPLFLSSRKRLPGFIFAGVFLDSRAEYQLALLYLRVRLAGSFSHFSACWSPPCFR